MTLHNRIRSFLNLSGINATESSNQNDGSMKIFSFTFHIYFSSSLAQTRELNSDFIIHLKLCIIRLSRSAFQYIKTHDDFLITYSMFFHCRTISTAKNKYKVSKNCKCKPGRIFFPGSCQIVTNQIGGVEKLSK